MEENKKDRKKWLLLLLLLLLVLVGGGLFLFRDKIFNADPEENIMEEYEDHIIGQKIDFIVDEIGNLLFIIDVELDKELTSDEVLNIDLTTYKENGEALQTYLASTRTFDIDGETKIYLAFDDYDPTNAELVDSVEGIAKIETREHDATRSYAYKSNLEPEVLKAVALYRVFMDLDTDFRSYSGVCKVNYDDETYFYDRVSYLVDIDFMGVSRENDFITKGEANLVSVDCYQFGYLWKK